MSSPKSKRLEALQVRPLSCWHLRGPLWFLPHYNSHIIFHILAPFGRVDKCIVCGRWIFSCNKRLLNSNMRFRNLDFTVLTRRWIWSKLKHLIKQFLIKISIFVFKNSYFWPKLNFWFLTSITALSTKLFFSNHLRVKMPINCKLKSDRKRMHWKH